MELLLLSNSTNAHEGFLSHVTSQIVEFVAGRALVFVPFALDDWDAYTCRVRDALVGVDVVGAHEHESLKDAMLSADVLFVGGGNTFRLLSTLQQLDVVDLLGDRVRAGLCGYIGSSAGTNVACPTIRTTNDMPIVDVDGFGALNLVPFQVNPHFSELLPPGLMVESRRERILQFLERSATPVVGLFEGSWIRVSGSSRTVEGPAGAIVFTRNGSVQVDPGSSLDRWWGVPVFDDRGPLL